MPRSKLSFAHKAKGSKDWEKKGKENESDVSDHEPPETVSVSLSAYTKFKPLPRRQANRRGRSQSQSQDVPDVEGTSSPIKPERITGGHDNSAEGNVTETEEKTPKSRQRGKRRVYNSSPLRNELVLSSPISPKAAKQAHVEAQFDIEQRDSSPIHKADGPTVLETNPLTPVKGKSRTDSKGKRARLRGGKKAQPGPETTGHIVLLPAPVQREEYRDPHKEDPEWTLSDITTWPPLQSKDQQSEVENTAQTSMDVAPPSDTIPKDLTWNNRPAEISERTISSGSRGSLNRNFRFPAPLRTPPRQGDNPSEQTMATIEGSPAPSETPMAFLAKYRDRPAATVPYEGGISDDDDDEIADDPVAPTTETLVSREPSTPSHDQSGHDHLEYKNQRDMLLKSLHGVAASGSARAAANNAAVANAAVAAATAARRTVMHDPMQQHHPPQGVIGPQYPSIIGTRPAGYQPSGDIPTTTDLSNDGWHPVTGPSEALPWRTRAADIKTIDTSKLTNDELRAHTKAWQDQRNAEFQLARGGRLAHEARIKERNAIAEAWWNRDTRGQGQENLRSYLEEVTARRANDPSHPEGATSENAELLIPLLCNLNSYMTESPYEGRGMFRDFKTPPEWSIDTSTGVGARNTAGDGGNNSLFGQDWGPPPQRLGRDPRYRMVNETGNTAFLPSQHRQLDVQHQQHRQNEIQHQQQHQQQAMMPPPPPPMAQQQPLTMQTMPSAMPQMPPPMTVQMSMQVPTPPSTTTAATGTTDQQPMRPVSPPSYHQFQPQHYQHHQTHQAQYYQQQYQQSLLQGGPRSNTLNHTTMTAHPHQYTSPYEMEMMNQYRPAPYIPQSHQLQVPVSTGHHGRMQMQNQVPAVPGTIQMNNAGGQIPIPGGGYGHHGQVPVSHQAHHGYTGYNNPGPQGPMMMGGAVGEWFWKTGDNGVGEWVWKHGENGGAGAAGGMGRF